MKKILATVTIAVVSLAPFFAAAQPLPSLMLTYPGSNTEGTPWAPIPADSMAWLVRHTYEIDPTLKENKVFRDTSLVNLMCNDIRTGRVRAFGTDTDSFTTVLDYEKVMAFTGKIFANSDSPCRIRLIEDLIGMKHTGQQYHRIIAIAPEMQHSTGAWAPLFWIYYPELKTGLANTKTNGKSKNAAAWLSVFDRRDYNARLLSAADTVHYTNIVIPDTKK